MRRPVLRALHAALLASCLAAASARADSTDPAKDLKSKDVPTHVAAVETLRKNGGPDAEKLLLGVLGDAEWEVAEHAAAALLERGGAESVGPLVHEAIEGPTRRIRLAAAKSAAKIDANLAAALAVKKFNVPDLAVRAAEALAIFAPTVKDDAAKKAIERALRGKEGALRAAIAPAIVTLPPEERLKRLEQCLDDEELAVGAGALAAVRAAPDEAYLPLLLDRLDVKDLNDVTERRLIAAIRAIIAAKPPGPDALAAAQHALKRIASAKTGQAMARLVRLAELLGAAPKPLKEGEAPPPPLVPADAAFKALAPALSSPFEAARSAAVHALGKIRSDEALDRAAGLAATDASARVRLHAMRAVVAARGVKHPGTLDLVCRRLSSDSDATVREEAAVALGVEGLAGARGALETALSDPDSAVTTCAAVSLGKTRIPAAIDTLRAWSEKAKDWRVRASAVVGWGHLQQKKAMPLIIEALNDKDPCVSRTAYEFLRRLTAKAIPAKADVWRDWWSGVESRFEFVDRDKEAREAKKYGYAPPSRTPTGVYENLDVVVLQSRGDHIEQLLDVLAIEHRMTRAGSVPTAGLHPFALFVSNCTGEIGPKDVERLAWFVRVGGHLFCSCWALHFTAELVCPGVVQKLETKAEVLDNVVAEPCPSDSPYLDQVFDGVTQPVYVLYGSHLIEVLDPERAEVLIDSPESATRWGGGNLAVWFTCGHGIILDSANHFDHQGLEHAEGLKTATDRMAYAMDHMGLTYEEVRKLREDKVWDSHAKAAKEARDFSPFRLISNFVRFKRLVDK